MKTIINLVIGIFILTNICFANAPGFKINVSDVSYTSGNTLEFDIYLVSTGADKQELRYALGQYFFEFNSDIANGGKLTYSLISSDLPEAMRPRNPSASDNVLKLLVNAINPDKSNLPLIPSKAPGLMVAKVRLETSADKFADVPLGLKLSDSKFKSKVFVYENNKNVELINSDINSVDGKISNPSVESLAGVPTEYALNQNYPNPFNPSTKISYDIPSANFVSLKIYDLTGREIATLVNENLEAGRYTSTFNGSNLASGIYFFRLSAKGGSNDFVQVRKMVLVK
jgi:hypothetical protein